MRAHIPLVIVALAGCVDCADDAAHVPSADTSTGSTTTSTTTSEDPSATEPSTTEPEVFDYEGEHVVVIADPGLELCGGTMAHMDSFIKRISSRLGVEPPTGSDRIRYTWIKDQDELKALCGSPEDLGGCAKGNRVYSMYAPLNHELVHSVSYDVGIPPSFFIEGLADAHEGHRGLALPAYSFSNNSDVEVTELIPLSSAMLGNIEDGYEKAGRFAAYLIARHGMERYLQLYAAIPRKAGLEEMEQIFQDVLGETLAESVAGLAPDWHTDHYDPQLSECNAPEIPWDGDLLEMSEIIYCPRENAIGPYDGDRVAVEYTIDIPVAGGYELRIVGDDQEATVIPDFDFRTFYGVSIFPCELGKSGFVETRVNGTPRLGLLHAGRNSLRILGSPVSPSEVKFTLKRIPPDPEDVFEDEP